MSKSKSRCIAIACCLTMASGCGTTPTPAASVKRQPPANLIQPCPDLPPLPSTSLASVLRNHVDVAAEYYECRRNHQGLIDWALR